MSFVFLALSDSDLKDKQRTCEASQLLLSQEELYTQGKKKCRGAAVLSLSKPAGR